MKKAFTLAEVMITLMVVGILTGILMPIAFHSAPNENVMKFKKGNATLQHVISELANSGEYYKMGDLGMKPDGSLVKSKTYFCETFADVVNTKSVACSSFNTNTGQHGHLPIDSGITQSWFLTDESAATSIDRRCDEYAKKIGPEIITSDGITYYQTAPNITFGMTFGEVTNYTSPGVGSCQTASTMYSECPKRQFPGPNDTPIYPTKEGIDPNYKIFCMDVDGIHPNSVALSDCKNECPFGYGIRADGKIFYGARAQEWMEKHIQDGD